MCYNNFIAGNEIKSQKNGPHWCTTTNTTLTQPTG